jgi:hypothetical protein
MRNDSSPHVVRAPGVVDSVGVDLVMLETLRLAGSRTKLAIRIPEDLHADTVSSLLVDSAGKHPAIVTAEIHLEGGRVLRLHQGKMEWATTPTWVDLVPDSISEDYYGKIKSIHLRSSSPIRLERIEWWSYGVPL